MAVPTSFLDGTILLHIETLHMSLMIETNKVGQIMDFFPWNGLFLLPIFHELFNSRLLSDRRYTLVTANTFIEPRDTRNSTAPAITMAIQAIDTHRTRMRIMRKFNRLLDNRAQISKPITGLGADSTTRNKWLRQYLPTKQDTRHET
ncbi:hypothetical protein LepocDRAFT_00004680 [Leptothrix ochracea L12]|uniref:Uncharacterized protein n=1 Tax=Leptothrix ochracea L12 TaxID=735332 RepID=I4Z685_9BURK|nr:hypothetical protein LepocDRAFT_00004680 [Leptothrix ochracea L12]